MSPPGGYRSPYGEGGREATHSIFLCKRACNTLVKCAIMGCVTTTRNGADMDYEAACKRAATDQGLDPVLSLLTGAGVPNSLDQTGGFCMAVHIPWGENPH